jgi:protein-S-isoprenylcysteine O-methyltransferase Ste14
MSTDAAHKRWWQIFEVIFGVPFLAGIGLQLAVPASLPRGFLAPFIAAGGAALIVAGITFIVLARRELARHRQPTDPGLPTSKLVTTGVFSVSRNPLYLGGICLLAGIALAFNLPWSFALLFPAIVACHYLLIASEERYLAARFGKGYAQYTALVRRWFGRVRDG